MTTSLASTARTPSFPSAEKVRTERGTRVAVESRDEIGDLQASARVMDRIFDLAAYRALVASRGNEHEVMLGVVTVDDVVDVVVRGRVKRIGPLSITLDVPTAEVFGIFTEGAPVEVWIPAEGLRSAVLAPAAVERDEEDEEGLDAEDDENMDEDALRAFIADLNEDEQASLIALAWIGRGDYDADDWDEALRLAAERNENILYFCLDNEGYMNTGAQKSSSTPHYASTGSTPSGKTTRKKNLIEIMAAHEVPYAATASVGHLPDLLSIVAASGLLLFGQLLLIVGTELIDRLCQTV